ncbi:uncharacterized protein GGS22DRAFT_98888 [Annulohypoxylon maeteangense]|uniref:uncharacterized protein n=1 Tax=Annulohypoxylon maeteangense TaxID=1927788 RepID=UPI0020079FF0|nr:uncharacterized protein GGS22DRAFT_98888 [Annulohypoxylon maeteangense]KAI0880173.1 hypothetical protein GGS22DRAFT_98888 [Annulohypoxylon maeteangense]
MYGICFAFFSQISTIPRFHDFHDSTIFSSWTHRHVPLIEPRPITPRAICIISVSNLTTLDILSTLRIPSWIPLLDLLTGFAIIRVRWLANDKVVVADLVINRCLKTLKPSDRSNTDDASHSRPLSAAIFAIPLPISNSSTARKHTRYHNRFRIYFNLPIYLPACLIVSLYA